MDDWLVSPLTIELAQEIPTFIGILLIRGTQLPRLLPRRFATGFLVTMGQKLMALIWRSIRLGLIRADSFLQLSTQRTSQSGKLRSVKSQSR